MTDTHMLRVFIGLDGKFGDIASVVVDEGRRINDTDRQAIARKLDTGETAFVNDIAKADISIMHPQGEIDFAGVAALAVSHLLTKLSDKPVKQMHGRGGAIATWQEDGITWVRAKLKTMPPWNHTQLAGVADVEGIKVEETAKTLHTMFWAWDDEPTGIIRARTFTTDWDIPEAEGNGSGALVLAAKLGRSIQIIHGKGSVMYAKPVEGGYGDIGGRVA